MILLLLLLVLLVPMPALAVPPEILVIHTLDDVHCSGIGAYESAECPTTVQTSTATPGYAACGNTGSPSVLNSISTGSFRITIDGSTQDFASVDFSGDITIDDIAATVQAALRTRGLVVFGGFANAFVLESPNGRLRVISGTSGINSSVSAMSATGTGTDVSGAGSLTCQSPAFVAGVDSFQFNQPMITADIDAMAAAGTRLTNLRVGRSCALSRTMMIGAGSVGRGTNLHGTNGLAWPAINTIEIDPYADNLVRRAKALGYTTAFFGKSHMGHDNFSEPGFVIGQSKTFLAELGFDYAEAVIRAQPGSLDRLSNTMTAAQHRCQGHNSWVSSDLAGNLVWETGYTSAVISDAVKAYIAGIVPGTKHAIFVHWSAPHQPSDYAQGALECGGAIGQAPAAGTAYAQDDRPPGDTTSVGFADVYRAGHEYVSLRIGEINSLLDLTAAGDDMVVLWSDNGVYKNAAPTECNASKGVKGTGFPCGTEVPFIVQGGDVARGEVNEGLFHTPDIPKTIGRLLGGNGGGIRDGMSFADCMTGTGGQTNATCLDHPVTHYTFWRPNGGQLTNPGNIQRAPRTDDVLNEWVEWERFAYSTRFGGNWTLRRFYQTNQVLGGLITFYEEFYETTLTDPYLANSNAPRASTQLAGNGKLGVSDFTAITANEQSAFLMMQAELDSMDLRDGRVEPNFSGVTY